MQSTLSWSGRIALFAAIGLASTGSTTRAGIVLSENLSNANSGVEAATGADWLASSFGTDSATYRLNSVTLLLQNPTAGLAELDIYSDGGFQPGSLVGTLASPTGFSSGLSDETFTTTGITLAANTTYWVVLHALSGEFDWGYTFDDSGRGAGFQDNWAASFDSGADWFDEGNSPTQMSVVATASAVPEPASAALLLAGLAAPLGLRLRRRARDA